MDTNSEFKKSEANMVTVRIFEVICEEFYFVGVCKPTDGI
jgi:hypothetical protein